MDILIDKENDGKTIKQLLLKDMGYSTHMLKKLKFSPDGILVNGQFKTVRYVLQEGDILSLACEDKEEDTSPYIIPVKLPINIAFEDEYLTVADKPHSMPAHPSLGHRDDTVANALAYRYKEKPYVFRPVNRLDRDTSGLMICANTRLAAYRLYQSMIGGKIKKSYIAILEGTPEKDEDILVSYMGRCEDSIVKRRIFEDHCENAKIAITAYRVIAKSEKYTVVVASPVTGRTHQLRLHFSSVGCAIAGDTMYGAESSEISRHALHSAYTSFPHPETSEILHLFSPLPEDIVYLIGCNMAGEIEHSIHDHIKHLMKQIEDYENKQL